MRNPSAFDGTRGRGSNEGGRNETRRWTRLARVTKLCHVSRGLVQSANIQSLSQLAGSHRWFSYVATALPCDVPPGSFFLLARTRAAVRRFGDPRAHDGIVLSQPAERAPNFVNRGKLEAEVGIFECWNRRGPRFPSNLPTGMSNRPLFPQGTHYSFLILKRGI